jgi:hypothetical protein
MYRRVWTPSEYVKKDTKEQIHFYDSGIICGTLYENEWSSWEIISRTIDASGCIIEMLKEMPQDYVPFQCLNIESHPLYEFSQDRIEIPGWNIRVEHVQVPRPLQAPQAPRPLQAPQPLHVDSLPPHPEVAHAQWPPEVLNELPRPAPRPPQRPVWPVQLQPEASPIVKRRKKPKQNNVMKSSNQHQSSQEELGVLALESSGQKQRVRKRRSQQSQACVPVQDPQGSSASANNLKSQSRKPVHQAPKEA